MALVAASTNQEKSFTNPKEWVEFYKNSGLKLDKTYRYNDASGKMIMGVIRLIDKEGRKTFRQVSPRLEPNGIKWVAQRPLGLCPIYDLDKIADAHDVVVCEGEKTAEAFKASGVPATTSPMGAGKAKEADWTPLAGKNVILWPDNDAPGRAHMQDVLEILEKLEPPCVLSLVDPTLYGIPEKGDAFDLREMWMERYNNDEELIAALFQDALGEAEPQDGSRFVFRHVEDSIAGKLENIPFPWINLTDLTQALLPKTVTMLCGDPGVSKTFLNLQLMAFWERIGVKASAYFFEDDKDLYMVRATAQYAKCGDFTKPKWCKENPEKSRSIRAQSRDFNIRLAPRIFVESDEERIPTYDQVLQWIESRAQRGDRVIMLDPITAIGVGKQRANEDLMFLMKAKSLARRYAFSLFLVTHPKQDKAIGASMSAMAGGAAFERFTHTILWLAFLETDVPTKIRCAGGEINVNCNRSIGILKSRNGQGKGTTLAYHFEPDSVSFVEQGVIVKKQPKKGR